MMHSRRSYLMVAACMVLTGARAYSQGLTELQGNISSIPFKKEQSPYIVTNDIVIPEDVEVVIPPGVVLLFKNSTSFIINGKLIAKGTPESPIVFTSYLDPLYSPEKYPVPTIYDWIGIQIAGTSKHVVLQNVQIKHAKFPVETLTPTIKFEGVQFIENMNSRLRINDQNYEVKPKTSFFYPLPVIPPEENHTPPLIVPPDSISTPVKTELPVPPNNNPAGGQNHWWKHRAFRVSLAALSVAAAGVAIYALNDADKHADSYDDHLEDWNNPALPDPVRLKAKSKAVDEYALKNSSYNAATVGFVVSGCLATGIGISFILPIKQ